MYRIKEIKEKLLHLVGWRQALNPIEYIDENMTVSESGLHFQSAHPLCTLSNIHAVMPDDWDYQYPQYIAGNEYKTGDKVAHLAAHWIAVNDTVSVPATGNPDWKDYNVFTDYLERLTGDGIVSAIQKFITMKNLAKETRNLLERQTFFEGMGRVANMLLPTSKLVGFEITPVRSMGVTTKIEKIGLQMAGNTGTVRVYLFHSSKNTPVKVQDLNFTVQNGGFQWFDMVDLYLPYTSENISPGGSWYLVYDQNALPPGMFAVTFNKDWSVEPCGTCNVGNLAHWRELMKYINVSPFMVSSPSDFEQSPELWSLENNMYTSMQNYGLNVEISIGCDLTDFIISQRSLFQNLIQQEVAAVALRTIALNPDVNVNRNQVNASREDILYELDGNTSGVKPGGLGYRIEQTIKSLRLDTQKIDRVCLSCNNGGIKFKTI